MQGARGIRRKRKDRRKKRRRKENLPLGILSPEVLLTETSLPPSVRRRGEEEICLLLLNRIVLISSVILYFTISVICDLCMIKPGRSIRLQQPFSGD